jgi:hypothetical protein
VDGLDAAGTAARLAEVFGVAAGHGIEVHRIDIAGVALELRFAGRALLPRLWPALAHHPPATRPPDVVVHLWDAGECGTPLVDYPADALDGGVTAAGRVAPPPPVRVRYQPDLRALLAYDRRAGLAWYEAAAADGLPWWETGAPLRSLLAWVLVDHGRALVHGAAVGDRSGAVLLVGRGGSGKSTTALAALDAGFGYLGDDYCVLDPGPPPRVHSLYATGKVTPATLATFPRLAAHVLNPDRAPDDKALVLPALAHPDALVEEAPLAAVVVPEIRDVDEAAVEPIGRAAALAALAPSTILQLPGAGGEHLRLLGALLREVPARRLVLGRDRASIVTCLRRLRAEVGGR